MTATIEVALVAQGCNAKRGSLLSLDVQAQTKP